MNQYDLDTLKRIFDFNAPPFMALDLVQPEVTALVSVKRGSHADFEATATPTHADIEILAPNGGRAMIAGLDLKALGPEDLLDVITKALPQAKSVGVMGQDADLLGPMMVAAYSARHLAKNLE